MPFDLWFKTSGTWINIATVLVGTGLGVFLGRQLPKRMQLVITQGLGLFTLFIGVTMAGSLTGVQAGKVDGAIVGLVAMVLGGLLGEWAGIEEKLEALGNWLKRHFKGQGKFTEGFVVASLLFCVGPMTLIGSLNNGLTGDDTLLVLKSAMDGLAAIALTSSYGIGVGFSSLIILLYQGGVSLMAGGLARSLPDPANNPIVLLITGVGGLMVLGTGINLLELTRIRTASFLPALLITPLLYWLLNWHR
ncbi:MAG: DUF554 domain-containing protein [Leptolyngbyaceae cyanobacterium SL_7_1]|nr:DUF554 domain-containing protein [Leptolyngbyaceae cyanobacterium SL_7_1]